MRAPLPFVAGLIRWWISGWEFKTPFFGFEPVRWLGVLLIALAIPVLLASFARFALDGLGTPAPLLPAKHLVIRGFYRYVRNPMYVAVVSTIIGQAFLFGSLYLLLYLPPSYPQPSLGSFCRTKNRSRVRPTVPNTIPVAPGSRVGFLASSNDSACYNEGLR